ncbi:MAG: MFS transporter [Alphaproteobacteria bacterium]|nr:MFS transporter [Alphaproteobacteria bacterium SS10]
MAYLENAIPSLAEERVNTARWKARFDLTLLVLTVAIVGAQSLMLSALVPDMAAGLAVGTTEIGIAIGAYGATTGLAAVLLGPRFDPLPRRYTLTFCLILLGVGLTIGAVATHWVVLAIAQGIGGVAAGVLLPMAYASASDMAPPGRNAEYLGKVLMGWSIAMIAGVPLGGVLGDTVGWRGALMVMAATALIVALGTSRLTRRRETLPDAGSVEGLVGKLKAAARVPTVGTFLAISFAVMFAFYCAYGFFGAHIRALHGGGGAVIGLLAAAYGAGFAAAGTFSGLIDRLGALRSCLISGVALLAIYAGLAPVSELVFVGQPWPIGVWMFLFGAINHVMINGYVSGMSATDAKRRGVILSLNTGVTYLGFMAGSVAGGIAFDIVGYGFVTVLSVLAIVGAVLAAWRLHAR